MDEHPASVANDDEPDLEPCYRHASRETALHCLTCERPICVDCSVTAAVGIKCPDCSKLPKSALGRVPTARLTRAAFAGVAAGSVAGLFYAFLGGGFLMLLLAAGLGMAVAEAVRWASGGFRDPQLARLAAGCAGFGLAVPLLIELFSGGTFGQGDAFQALGAIIAAVVAYNRSA